MEFTHFDSTVRSRERGAIVANLYKILLTGILIFGFYPSHYSQWIYIFVSWKRAWRWNLFNTHAPRHTTLPCLILKPCLDVQYILSAVHLVTWSTSICIVAFYDVIKGWRVQTLFCLNSRSLAKCLQIPDDAVNMLGSPSDTQSKLCLKKIEKIGRFLFDTPISCISYFADKKMIEALSQTCNYAETQTTQKRICFSAFSEPLVFLSFF